MKRRWISIPFLLAMIPLIGVGMEPEAYAHASLGNTQHNQIALAQRAAQTTTVAFGGVLGFAYSPQDSFIMPGDTIRWLGDLTVHPLVSENGLWQQVSSGSEFSFTFVQPGRYSYHCFFHGAFGMSGTVTVGETYFLPFVMN